MSTAVGATIPRPLSAAEVGQLDPYAFFAVLGKRVIHPGGRTATDALIRLGEFGPGQQVGYVLVSGTRSLAAAS